MINSIHELEVLSKIRAMQEKIVKTYINHNHYPALSHKEIDIEIFTSENIKRMSIGEFKKELLYKIPETDSLKKNFYIDCTLHIYMGNKKLKNSDSYFFEIDSFQDNVFLCLGDKKISLSDLTITTCVPYVIDPIYRKLGFKNFPTNKEIKKEARRILAKAHPDKNPDNSIQAEENFKDLTNIIDIFTNGKKRKTYENFLKYSITPEEEQEEIELSIENLNKIKSILDNDSFWKRQTKLGEIPSTISSLKNFFYDTEITKENCQNLIYTVSCYSTEHLKIKEKQIFDIAKETTNSFYEILAKSFSQKQLSENLNNYISTNELGFKEIESEIKDQELFTEYLIHSKGLKAIEKFSNNVPNSNSANALKRLSKLGKTFDLWKDEIVRMWRFSKSNGITEGFHRKMKLIQRRAYGFRNFDNYRLRNSYRFISYRYPFH